MINLKKRLRTDRSSAPESFYLIDCLLAIKSNGATATSSEEESVESGSVTSAPAEVIPIRMDCVVGISAVRLVIPKDLRVKEARAGVLNAIDKVKTRMGGTLPPLDPVDDMHITDAKFIEINRVHTFVFAQFCHIGFIILN